MIWIIGGTLETRELVDRLYDYNDYIVTVATESGAECINANNLFIGRLNKEEMICFVQKYNVDLIVDLSHPYAKIVSKNAKEISQELGIKYIKYIRKKTELKNGEIYLDSYEDSYKYISNISGVVFFTIGSNNIENFEKIKGNNRFIYRILPAKESIEICRKNNINMKDIVAILGPFSKEFNKLMLSMYNADYCVMKDSGIEGGTLEKVEACKELGVKPIIIGRKDEEGISNLSIIEKVIKDRTIELFD